MKYAVCHVEGRPEGAFLQYGESDSEIQEMASRKAAGAEIVLAFTSENPAEAVVEHIRLADGEQVGPGDARVTGVLNMIGWNIRTE